MSVRPKKVSRRKEIGLDSRWTHSSNTLDGRHGGGLGETLDGCGEAALAEAVEYACTRTEIGRHKMLLKERCVCRAKSTIA